MGPGIFRLFSCWRIHSSNYAFVLTMREVEIAVLAHTAFRESSKDHPIRNSFNHFLSTAENLPAVGLVVVSQYRNQSLLLSTSNFSSGEDHPFAPGASLHL